MQLSPFVLRRPLFFLLTGGLLFFCLATGFLYKEKQALQKQTRQLLIQNDSVMSVNIVLTDSIRRRQSFVVPENASLISKAGLK